MSRQTMGHTEVVMLKLHPDMMNHIRAQAAKEYCTNAEIMRRLIIQDMRKGEV
jgi:hypothetical protein